MAVTRTWRVYGSLGHRQRESFKESYSYDFTGKYGRGLCRIDVENSDKTGTNDYTVIRITTDSAEECQRELDGQVSDGIFENSRTGEIVEI